MENSKRTSVHKLSRSPPLTYRAGLGIKALGGDGVDLVDKDDGGRVLTRQSKDVPDHARAFT